MKKIIFLICIGFVFSCAESKYPEQEKAVREQMKKMDGAAAYADKVQIEIIEIPAKKVYGILSQKAVYMMKTMASCISPECKYEMHRYTEKKLAYDKLMADSGKKVYYQAHVMLLEEKDTVVSSYMFLDDADTFIDFTPKLHP
ncbi:hypothetical protein [Flavobacterium pallidum]|uniref:Uncharacterized protein n=1 Tax=Flavobacterium pallidum TaxID=2172098 RepID=A0A2S1SJ28_9FLAO|nr:hypothetical protein [Flavobacterium pallidum]AWI26403.1 hypothetical protein HYN49_11090 [Flavobacterium pallidum]